MCPGHALLDATIDLILERYRDLLERGAVLVDPNDPGTEVRALVYLEHAVQDARLDRAGNRRVISKRVEFVELDGQGGARDAGPAPYLDYRPIQGLALGDYLLPEQGKPVTRMEDHAVPTPGSLFIQRRECALAIDYRIPCMSLSAGFSTSSPGLSLGPVDRRSAVFVCLFTYLRSTGETRDDQ